MRERRKIKRQKISYYLQVLDAQTFELIGHLVEITTKGLQIDSTKPLPIGKDFNLRLDLTDQSFQRSYVTFIARSRWYRPDTMTPNWYNVGFEIVSIAPNDAEVVAKIVERYSAHEGYSFPTG